VVKSHSKRGLKPHLRLLQRLESRKGKKRPQHLPEVHSSTRPARAREGAREEEGGGPHKIFLRLVESTLPSTHRAANQ
jgi:hypothetical protein